MRVEHREGGQENRILTGMIVDSVVCGRIASKWGDGDHFQSKWCNIIGGWCTDYFLQYGEAPKKDIVGLFESWTNARDRDPATVKLLDKFLSNLSDDYETLEQESNSEYVIDQAAAHFNKVQLVKLADAIKEDAESGEVDQGYKRAQKLGKMEIGVGAVVDVFRDQTAIMRAFEERQEPIIKYPGALGELLGSSLERDGFIGVMGRAKRGKSWMLEDIGWVGVEQRRKVAFFQVGDLSQNQMMRRWMVRAAGRPLGPKVIKFPTKIEKDEDEDIAVVTYKEREFSGHLSWQRAWKACQDVVHNCRTDSTLLRLSCHPSGSISINGVIAVLDNWEREDWVPDIVIIDYADILAPISGTADTRDQINATWMKMRGLSQQRHCLVVTATQAKAAGYHAATLDMSHFSEDRRKMDHVTGMLCLNATPEEKTQQILRVNWGVLREDEWIEGQCVHVAGCLSIASPCIISTW